MPTRIYICPITGVGTEEDPQRAVVMDDPEVTACCAAIATTPATGRPTFGWAICRVTARNFTGVDAIEGVVHIPAAALNAKIPAQVRTKLAAKLGNDVVLTATDTVRGVLRKLVQAHYPHADEEAVL